MRLVAAARFAPTPFAATLFAAVLLADASSAADWSRFRGPNGGGVSDSSGLPAAIGPQQNVVWKTALPEGHSSPIVSGDLIFVTAAEGGTREDAGREKVIDAGGRLFTIAIRRDNGEILWKREAPRPRMERYQPTNSAASPSPATDGENVYVFFGDFGLLAYSRDGTERWRVPLGPFTNPNGHGSSPIVVDDKVVLICDDDTESYLLAVDKHSGEIAWKAPRREVTRSYTTPAVYVPASGPAEVIVPGAYYLTAYSAETGEKLWWVSGLSWQPKSTPVVAGELVFANSVEGGGGGAASDTPTFAEMLAKADRDGDGLIDDPEIKAVDPSVKRFEILDLDGDGRLDDRDWEFYRARKTSRSRLVAVRPGGRGDVTDTHVSWSLERFLPNVPSPLVYEGVLYLVKDGGILTALDAETGAVLKQGRLTGALDQYYASPVAADGKVYLLSQLGRASVVEAGEEWELLGVSDFEDEAFATPAIVDDRIYLRTKSAMYCFAKR